MPENAAKVPDGPHVTLSLLATTDLHGALVSYDYFADQPGHLPALSRIATLINEVRATADNTLLLDNGDFLQGTPLTDLVSDRSPDGLTHPLVAAMNTLGYDAAALGNHEFNVDLERLTEILGQINATLVCANLAVTGEAPEGLAACWQPQCILERQVVDSTGARHGLRIGVFGVVPPQVLSWDHSRVAGKLTAEESLVAARRAVSDLRAAGADLVIGLAHTGLGDAPEQEGLENAGHLIAGIDGLDALVLGHTHLRFPGTTHPAVPGICAETATVHGTPTMQPGSGGRLLGRMDLCLVQNGQGWQVAGHSVELMNAQEAEEDAALSAVLRPAHDWVLEALRKPVGHIRKPLHSGLARLPGCATVRVVAEALAGYVAEARKGTDWADLPVLAAAAPQKCGGRAGPQHFTDISAGRVALNNISDLQFFPNDVSVLRLNGAELAEWLEMSAGLYAQILPGQADQPLCRTDFPVYNCDAIYGLRYDIDLSQPARYGPDGTLINPDARRIGHLHWQGAPLRPEQNFALAVNNYRAGGGGNFPYATPERILLQEKTKIRDLLVQAFAEGDPSVSETPPPARFAPIEGATALFLSSPDMRDMLRDAPVEGIDILGETPEGFLQMRLRFE